MNSTIDHVVNELVNEPLIGALSSRIGIHGSRFMNQLENREVQRHLNVQKLLQSMWSWLQDIIQIACRWSQ